MDRRARIEMQNDAYTPFVKLALESVDGGVTVGTQRMVCPEKWIS